MGVEYELGDFVIKEPGNMIGPGQQAFADIFSDPAEQGIVWNDAAGCPVKAGACVGAESRRVRPVVMFDPQEWPNIDNGAKPVPITAFGGMFLDHWDGGNEVWIRFMRYQSVSPAADPDFGASGSLLRVLRIVE